MRSVRPLLLITACLCLVTLLAGCRGKGSPQSAAASQGASRTPAVSGTPRVPSPTPSDKYYVVDFGDTLSTIAERYSVSEAALVSLNKIPDANAIKVGQRLLLPANAVEPTVVARPMGSVEVPILLYHHLEQLSEGAGKEWQVTTVTPQAFEEQMSYLAYNGYHTVKIMDVVNALEGRATLPAKPVVITFDDGWIDGWDVALPILQKYKMTASFFIIANGIGYGDNHTMNWAQVEALSAAGMEIGSHSMTHPYLTQLDGETLAWELSESKRVLEEHVSEPVEVLAYPFGFYDGNVIAKAEAAGYRAALTVEDGWYVTPDNLLQMPRITVPYDAKLDMFEAMITPPAQPAGSSGG